MHATCDGTCCETDGRSSTRRGAQENGAVTDKVYLSQCTIGPCHACDACADTGICVQRDDMDDLLVRMNQSDIWVLGTPVYWWGASAPFKLFLDRWYAPWHNADTKGIFDNRKAALVVTMGDSTPSTADPTLGMFERALSYVGIEIAATVLAPGVGALGEAAAHSELMKKAREAGRTVVNS
ncbi:flavodoxin family protein [Candidatus Bipolaricaulota bacterium]